MIQLKISLTIDDYVDFLIYKTQKDPYLQKNQKQGKYIFFAMFLVLAATFFFLKNNALAVCFIIFGLVFFLLYSTYMKWFFRRSYKRTINRMKDFDMRDSFWTLEDNSITEIRGDKETTVPTTDIQEVEETKKHFYVHLMNSNITLIFPKSQLENEEEVRAYFNSRKNLPKDENLVVSSKVEDLA